MTTPWISVHQYPGAVLYTPSHIVPPDPTIMRCNQHLQKLQKLQPQHWPYNPLLAPISSGQRWTCSGSASSPLNLALSPRSFEEIQAEQRFLIDQLNQRNEYATKQLRKWAFGEEATASINGLGRHEANNNRQCLQRRIAEITAWETGILRRLSKLHLEIQCRERWCQVQQEMMEMQAGQWKEVGRYDNLSRHPLLSYHPSWGHLPHLISASAYSIPANESVKSGFQCNSDKFAPDWGYQYEQYESDGDFQDAKPIGDLPSPCGMTGRSVLARDIEWNQKEKMGEAKGTGYTSTQNVVCTKPTRKRMSLPSLQYSWTDANDMEDDGHICLGYAIEEETREAEKETLHDIGV